jgi:1-acyl-sn-glycerol-3-phosphate acyltransferase
VVALLQGLRSVLGLACVLALWLPGTVVFYLYVLPLSWLRPGRRLHLVSWFMKGMAGSIRGCLRVGGARFETSGTLPTDKPTLIVANHQSLIDILTATLLARPYAPAFVTRGRYARFIPLVSPCVRMLGCPIVDPRRDARGAVKAVGKAAEDLRHGLLIFPEGHRSRDGEIRRFRTAGLEAILAARRLQVYLLISDGVWTSRRFIDFVLNVHTVRGRAEVLGPFEPPVAQEEAPAFIAELRARLVAHLELMRSRRGDDG